MLEGLLKGLALWLYGLFLEIVEYIADSLLEVFNMDLAYFEANVPVTREIMSIIIAAGWAILIGNLAFQAMKSMMSGIGFEGEDPKILFCRTFVFSFLLLASRQICQIGLSMTSQLNTLLQTPNAVRLSLPPLDIFVIPGSWLLVMIIGLILMFQIVKFFFEIAERYVVLVILTILAPLAFGVGGSKNTEDIFKGWARMFGSACLMMLFNTVFLKLLLSAMDNMPSAEGMLPWLLLVVAIARVARKIDDIVARIGLNTARTGDPIGRGGIMYPIMVMKTLGGIVSKTVGAAGGAASATASSGRPSGGGRGPAPPSSSTSSASPPPPTSGPSSGGTQPGADGVASASAPAGAQPAMSATIPGAGKESPPSRPPVGIGRNGVKANTYRRGEAKRDADDAGSTKSGKPPLSVDSRIPSDAQAVQSESARSFDGTPQNGNNNMGRQTAPPLSVDSRTPDRQESGVQKPASDSTGNSPARAGGANAQQRARPRKPANIDIYKDDDQAAGRSSQRTPRPASTFKGQPPASSSQASHASSVSGSISHAETRNTKIQRKVGEAANVSTNAANPAVSAGITPPSRASSPGAGRVGGLHQHDDANRPNGATRAGGTVIPGASHRRPTNSTSNQESMRPSSVSHGSSKPTVSSADTRNVDQGTSTNSARTSAISSNASPSFAQHSTQINSQNSKPMRYKRVERNSAQPPGNAATRPAPGRPASGAPEPGAQPSGRGPDQGGGNRP